MQNFVTLPAGTRLFHGTDARRSFNMLAGPAWLTEDFDLARPWAGWKESGGGGRQRVLEFKTTRALQLINITDKKQWTDLGERLLGDPEPYIWMLADKVKEKGYDGWWSRDFEVMVSNPSKSLKLVKIHNDVAYGDNPPVPEARGTTQFGYGGIPEGFKIESPSGATAIGYAGNADFPGDSSSPTRGELFLVSVPNDKRRVGEGMAISIQALRLMRERGCTTVNMSATSKGGAAIVDKLIRGGHISEVIRTSATGKSEYGIAPKENPPARFWGKAGAGVLFHCRADGTYLLTLRSSRVQQPHTLGIPGGACGRAEGFFEGKAGKPVTEAAWRCAVRECREELRWFPGGKALHASAIITFQYDQFQYRTFVVEISEAQKADAERSIRLNWENDDHVWMTFAEMAEARDQLHYGVRAILEQLQAASGESVAAAATEARNPFYAKPTGYRGATMSGVITHPGFHTGESLSVCQPYAQAKVMDMLPSSWGKELQRHALSDYPVIVELDMQGVPFEIDYDAANWFKDAVEAVIESSDTFDDFDSSIEFGETEEEMPESMITALFYLSGANPQRAAGHLRNWLTEQGDPDEAYARIKAEGLPDELLAKVSGQFRYTSDVPTGRIVAVNYIRPVFDHLFPHYDDPDWHHDAIIERIEALGYDVVTLENVYDGREVLSVDRRVEVSTPKLWSEDEKRIEYHGTSLSNLLLAAPELKDVLPTPPKPFALDAGLRTLAQWYDVTVSNAGLLRL